MGLLTYLKPAGRKAKETQATTTSPSLPLSPLGSPNSTIEDLSQAAGELLTLKVDMMCDYLRQQQLQRRWASDAEDQGVVIKKARGQFVCSPNELIRDPQSFVHEMGSLNVKCAITIDTPVLRHFTKCRIVSLPGGLQLQVLPDISFLSSCQKHQCAAFIANKAQLIVWDDDPMHVLDRAAGIEADLLSLIWQAKPEFFQQTISEKPSKATMMVSITSGLSSETASIDEIESGEIANSSATKVVLLQPAIAGLAIGLSVFAIGTGWSSVAKEIMLDGSYIRCTFFLMIPFTFFTSLFFWQALVVNIVQLFGPIKQVHESSRFYSGKPPKRLDRGGLPHITIQMPVYKEGLESVIVPTVRSLNTAIATYQMQGGTASIFVNDDGMQLVSESERLARQEFYEEYNIGWTARPAHNPKGEKENQPVFLRRGKFKKASNMNYGIWISVRIEEKLQRIQRGVGWTTVDESVAYEQAMIEILEEDEGRTWADGNIRIGDYVLIVDSDTRVPRDCLLDAASEMEQNPSMAVLQYASGVMNVTDNFFEKGITFFTNLVYSQIRYCVSSGDVAPFVGHNAFLRWDALQSIEYACELDHRTKWWSEETVSEDFDMSLRLQAAGFLVRLAGYSNNGETYDEGVSLTVYDELMRWEKYAYGCSELLFHPLRYWFTRGPFTKVFRMFLVSPMPFTSKMSVLGYIGTYYAIGSAWLLTLVNYFAVGWWPGTLDEYYLPSFSMFITIIVVFTLLGNVALAVMRWRSGEKGLLAALLENYSWVPLLSIFLGGISLHVSQALVSHLIGVDMQWGSTAKEIENRTFFEEIPLVAKGFKWTFCFSIGSAVMMLVLAKFVPVWWRIDSFVAIGPLALICFCHAMLPIALNPNLIVFKW